MDVPTDQFIVKFKEVASISSAEENQKLSRAASEVGAAVSDVRAIASGASVLQLDEKLSAARAEQVLDDLRSDPDIEFAEPDQLMQPMGDPNDSFFPLQWDMWEETAGMRMPEAWAVSKGAGATVAVIDTGITSHSDLNANVLPGYDMISNAYRARDADGRDANPQDEGDWTSDGQCGSGTGGAYSSWHGTHVAGTVAAIADNGQGVTGVAPEAKILPIRALGVCGGYTSDIADSIIWSAGGEVPGAPINPNPAGVINLSLGGTNACSSTYQSAIDFAYDAGSVVVVAAGNSNRPAADSAPANCQNVIAVGASTRGGGRAPYSNYGGTVDVSAPGGDMSQSVQNGIASTLNNGAYGPVAENYVYSQGTSMAAPHVAGLAALMMAETGGLSPALIEEGLKSTSRPMPLCSEGCGAGLVDAARALGVPDPQPDLPLEPAVPTVSGVLSEYHQLVAAPGDWGPDDVAFTYEWLADGRPISGAGGPTLNLSLWEIGDYISVRVTGRKAGYVPETRTSERVGPVTFDWQGRKAIPAAVAFMDRDGTAEDTYTIPFSQGVDYVVGESVMEAGTYPAAGEVSVLARPQSGYSIYWGATTTWSAKFKASPYKTTPTAVVFSDAPGSTRDTYTVPMAEGVNYLQSGKSVAAGTYAGSGTVTVSATTVEDYIFLPEAATEWSFTFDAAAGEVVPKAVVFMDKDGTAEDEYTVPVTEGVEYLVGDKVTAAGAYPGSGTVTVTARAMTDYVLAPGATAEWSHEFKATPYPVTPAAVVFMDKDGTAGDTYVVPVTEGVEYLVGDKVTAAGTYPGSGTVTVTARAKADYVLASGASAEWSHEFKATPYSVTPAAVVFTDKDGTAEDTFTVPVTEGVEYLVGEKVTAAGTYPGSGTVTVTARAKTDYVLAPGASAEWSHEFKATPYQVVPAAVVFMDKDGTAEDTYTIPGTEGVEYLVGDKVTAAGTYPGTGTIAVTARAKTDYVLAEGAVAEWSYTFKTTSAAYVPPADSPFVDVSTGQQFYREMAWLAERKISTGWDEGNGVRAYRPLQAINRDAMAAFLYRMAGSPEYAAPAVSPFADVSTGQQFYKEMAWLAEQKISTGWDEGNGVRTYRPLHAINRDAMAAFLYRMAGSPEYTVPAVSPFADVSTGQQFYKEMAWLAEQKISTGWDEGNSVRTYRPLQAINRDAMAAFLFRLDGLLA
ncbi:S8 family peptidase [Pseudarthrobacter scleromae]|uniref:S8 family peptidase n=1 Tax=Pseudarthrobacter scleromae TaxID=158897 RepID=UPI003CFC91B0